MPIFGNVNKANPILFMESSFGWSYVSRNEPGLAETREISSGAFIASNKFLTLPQITDIILRNFDLYKTLPFLLTTTSRC